MSHTEYPTHLHCATSDQSNARWFIPGHDYQVIGESTDGSEWIILDARQNDRRICKSRLQFTTHDPDVLPKVVISMTTFGKPGRPSYTER